MADRRVRETPSDGRPDHSRYRGALQYGKPHYLKNGQYAAVIAVAKDKVSFMVFNATDVPAVKGFLRALGTGERKAVDIREDKTSTTARLPASWRETASAL